MDGKLTLIAFRKSAGTMCRSANGGRQARHSGIRPPARDGAELLLRYYSIARCRRLATTLRSQKIFPSWRGLCIEVQFQVSVFPELLHFQLQLRLRTGPRGSANSIGCAEWHNLRWR